MVQRVYAKKDNLKKSRIAFEFSQTDFAHLLTVVSKKNVTLQAYAKYEKGLRGIDVQLANSIARILNKKLDYLFEIREKDLKYCA